MSKKVTGRPLKKAGRKKRPRPKLDITDPDGLLTPRSRLFIELYFLLGFNPTEAARRVGLKVDGGSRSQAYRLLNSAPVQAAIAKRFQEIERNTEMTLAETKQHMAEIVRDRTNPPGPRVSAAAVHERLCGRLDPLPLPLDRPDSITPDALRLLSPQAIIARINKRELLPSTQQAKIIDVVGHEEKTG